MMDSLTRTLIIAHRGASSLAPENTLASARKALELGADLWELDVAMSQDGELFLLHDDTLERTSNAADIFPGRRPWNAWEFTFEEIRLLDFGSWYGQRDPRGLIAAGVVSYADACAYCGEPAPTLREALMFTREHDWRVNVEIKDLSGTPGDGVVVERVVGLIQELGMGNRVMISSFKHDYLRQVRALDMDLVTAALVEEAHPQPAALLAELGAQAYNPELGKITAVEIAALRALGYGVNIWTVNEEADMRALAAAGANGLFTDYPQRMKAVLREM